MTAQTAISPAQPEPKRRISPAIRHALTLRVRQGYTWSKAAATAGLSEAGIHKARKKQHVQELQKQLELQYIQDVEAMKAPFKAQALEVGNDLLHNSKSDVVKARMVEFFAGETRGNSVNVAVQVNNQPAQGYAYVRPGQDVVRIEPSPDSVSGDVVDVEPIKQGD